MTKAERTGAAPVSKYAAKRAARYQFDNDIEKNAPSKPQDDTEKDNNEPAEDANFKRTRFDKESAVDYVRKKTNFYKGNPVNRREIPNTAFSYPEHFVQIALLIKNNAEIRRFTSLGILNYLYQKNEIKGTDGFVSFKWNKFAVKYKGLMREYSYIEPFFLNALVASFTSFAASAQRVIDKFCKTELMVHINKAVDEEEVAKIVEANQKHQEEKPCHNADDAENDDEIDNNEDE